MPNYALGTNAQGQGMGSIVPGAAATQPVTTAIPVSTATTTPTPIQVPPAPTPDTHAATNASVASPIPTAQDIVNADTQPTATQGTQSGILGKIASLMGGKQSLSTLQTGSESAAGVPALTKTLNDLGTQLNGLNDQATALQNAAMPGGTIENQMQQSATGRGETTGGLAPQQSAALRNNQIQQATIASQALTVKSAYYAANGNLTLAKDAADKAAQVAFDAQDQEINYQQSLLAAIQPQLDEEQKAQATKLQADLADRQTAISNQREDYKTGIALASAALKNNPNDPVAAYNAQQALKLDPNDPNYLTKVNALVGKYQTDLVASQLDQKLKNTQIAEGEESINTQKAQQAKIYQDMKIAMGGSSNLAQTNVRTTTSGINYIDGTNLSAADARAAQQYAAKNGIPYLGAAAADLQNNVETARTNMQNIAQTLDGLLPTSGLRVDQKLENLFQSATQIGPSADKLASFNAYRSAAIQALRAMAGAKGLRINQAEIMQSVNQDIPKITDTVAVAQSKIAIVNSLLDSQEKGTFGSQFYKPDSTQNAAPTVIPQEQIPTGYYQASDGLLYKK